MHIEKEERFYKVIDDGKVCGVGCASVLKKKTEREIIAGVIARRQPKAPKKEIKLNPEGDRIRVTVDCFCPSCGWRLGEIADEHKYFSCADCGQVIDWNERRLK